MKVELRAAQNFLQGETFRDGETIPDATWQGWQAETLANRLANGFVKWTPVPEEASEEPGTDPSQMSKKELLAHIQKVHGVAVDDRISKANMLQQLAALDERARLVAAKNAQDAADAAAAAANTPPADPAASDTTDTGTGSTPAP